MSTEEENLHGHNYEPKPKAVVLSNSTHETQQQIQFTDANTKKKRRDELPTNKRSKESAFVKGYKNVVKMYNEAEPAFERILYENLIQCEAGLKNTAADELPKLPLLLSDTEIMDIRKNIKHKIQAAIVEAKEALLDMDMEM